MIHKNIALSMALITITVQTHDLIDMRKFCPSIICDIRYATTNNFTKKKIYDSPGCYLHKDAAVALKKAVNELAHEGLGIKIFDAYRPLSAQQKLWEAYPMPGYVADPRKGGKHTRGTAVDITLIRLIDGSELAMPTAFDSFEEKAWSEYQNLPAHVLANRTKLQKIMRKHGFMTIKKEWWHFDLKGYQNYPPLNILFKSLE